MPSGVSLRPWAMGYPRFDRRPKDMADRLGCGLADSSRLVACLRTKEASTIVNVSMEVQAEVRGYRVERVKPSP